MRTFEKPLLALSALALLGALAITARAEDGAAKPTTSSDYKSSETKWKFNPGSGATEAVEIEKPKVEAHVEGGAYANGGDAKGGGIAVSGTYNGEKKVVTEINGQSLGPNDGETVKSGVLLAPGATAQLQFNAATGKFDLVKIDAKGGALYHLESSKIPGLTIDVNAAKLGATVGTDQRTGVTTVGPTVTALEASAHGATSIKWSQDGQEKFSVGLEGYGKVAVGNFSLGYVDNNGHGGFGSAQLVSVTAGGAVTLPRILTLRDEVTIGSTTSIPDGASMGWSNLLAVDGVGKKGSVVNQFGLGWQHNQDGARVDGDAGFAKNVTSNFLLLRWTPKLPGDGKSDAN